jgi:hypothetical protein
VRGGKIGGFGTNAAGKSDILTNRSAPPSSFMPFSFTSEQKPSILWRATGVTTALTTSRSGIATDRRSRHVDRHVGNVANFANPVFGWSAHFQFACSSPALHMRLRIQSMNSCFYRQS